MLDDSSAELPDFQPITETVLEFIEKSVQDVLHQLKSLDTSKAYGPDGISPKLLEEGKDILAVHLSRLYNLSLRQEKFPAMLKRANVLPIHKKDEKDLC